VYIVEIGAGTGKFAFLFLRKLFSDHADLLPPGLKVKYIITVRTSVLERESYICGATSNDEIHQLDSRDINQSSNIQDFVEQNVEFWRKSPHFQYYSEQGFVDFATFDAMNSRELKLRVSGATLTSVDFANPLIVLANYVIDSLLTDAFSVVNGELHEVLLSVKCEADVSERGFLEEALSSSGHWWTTRALQVASGADGGGGGSSDSIDYYSDSVDSRLNAILAYYYAEFRKQGRDGTFMMPVGAASLIRNLMALSNERLLMVCADKATINFSELCVVDVPDVYLHGGACFSFTANFHAIAKYFELLGGFAIHCNQESPALPVSLFFATKLPEVCERVSESGRAGVPLD